MSAATHKVALRSVAMFEAAKGVLVLLVGFGLLTLVHRDIDTAVYRLTELLHLRPHGRLSDLFFKLADHADDIGLWKLAAAALAYATVRFVEAFGLWRERAWAEWFALLSGCIYLPLEIYEIIHRPRPLKWMVLAVNIIIVLYMAKLRFRDPHRA